MECALCHEGPEKGKLLILNNGKLICGECIAKKNNEKQKTEEKLITEAIKNDGKMPEM